MNKSSSSGNALEVFAVFLKLGLTSFGGPIAHLGYYRRELIARRSWLEEGQFGQLVAVCQMLPGPTSSQIGFSIGMLRAGWRGALAAFVGFTLPSALLMYAFASFLPMVSGQLGQAVIHGLKLIAFAVVADALVGMAAKLCPDLLRAIIAGIAALLVLSLATAWAQLLVVAGGALVGLVFCRPQAGTVTDSIHPGYRARTGSILLALFAALLICLPLLTSLHQLDAVASAFYLAGALVFGGGHVVLPLLQDFTVTPGWVDNASFLAGYGAAQAIPGPMFTFSAFLGGLIPTGYAPWVGALTALLFMFLPGLLLVAGVLPLWHHFTRRPFAAEALAGINAAVVGLLVAAFYHPICTTAIRGPVDLAIGFFAFIMLTRWHIPVLLTVIWCVVASVAQSML